MDRKEIAAVLAMAGMRPRHRFGQNFMVDQNILRAIADAGDIHADDVILEVGPGVGNLTRLLAERVGAGGAVLAVDIDRKLLPAAKQHHAALTNVEWMLGDVLAGKHEINPEVVAWLRELCASHAGGELKLVSNLPYNAASPLVAELLVEMWRGRETRNTEPEMEKGDRPLIFSRLAFTVQWEMAARLRAAIGTGDYGPLGVLVQLMAEVEIVRKIAPGAFWPAPKVDSALVIVRPDAQRMRDVADAPGLQRFLAGVFSHRRQTLHNALRHYWGEAYTGDVAERIARAGIDVGLRPERVTAAQFLELAGMVEAGLDTPPARRDCQSSL